MKKALCIFALLGPLTVFGSGPRIGDSRINISWQKSREGWQPRRIELRDEGQTFVWGTPDGGYTVLYTPETPPTEGETVVNRGGDTLRFDIDRFHCIVPSYRKATSSVPLNRAGEAFRLVPQEMHRNGDTLRFEASGEPGQLTAEWWADTIHPGDLCVRMTFTAARAGYYSLSTPATATLPEKQLAWGCVPGFFQGAAIEPDFHLAYMYGQGLPHLPVICNENTVTTMASLLTDTQGLTLAVIPEPGYDRKPYVGERRTHGECWRTGLSHMTRDGRLCPTAWHPVLGEEGSWLEAGGQTRFAFRYTLRRTDWYEVFKHVVYDIYGLKEELALRRSRISLTDRLEAICRYVCDDSLSLWRTEYCEGIEIGAQAYLGSVVGSEKDAMKNADAGAVWMLAAMTGDSLLRIHPPAVGECTRPAEGPGTARLAAEPDGALLRTRRKHGIGDQERSHPADEPLRALHPAGGNDRRQPLRRSGSHGGHRPGGVPSSRHEDRHLLLVAVRPRPGTFPASCLVAAGMDRRLPALRSRMPQRRSDRLPTGLRDAQGRTAAHHRIRTRTHRR